MTDNLEPVAVMLDRFLKPETNSRVVESEEHPDAYECGGCSMALEYKPLMNIKGRWIRPLCRCEQEEKHAELIKEATADEERSRQAMITRSIKLINPPWKFKHATFEESTVDADNRTAIKQITSWCDKLDSRGLYIYGPVGCGKTHLAWCAMRRLASMGKLIRPDYRFRVGDDVWQEEYRTLSIGFINAGRWIDRCMQFRDQDVLEEVDVTMQLEALGFDDIGVENVSSFTTKRIYDFINYRYENGLLTIITSNFDLDQLAGWLHSDRIASRIAGMCTQVPVGGEDRR